MDETEIIERIDKFFDKEGLDIQSKFILTKRMSEEYWEEVLGEGEQDDDLLGDLGEEEPEQPTEEPPEEDIAAPKPPKKKKITVNKPKVTTKKEETKEPEEEKQEDVTI